MRLGLAPGLAKFEGAQAAAGVRGQMLVEQAQRGLRRASAAGSVSCSAVQTAAARAGARSRSPMPNISASRRPNEGTIHALGNSSSATSAEQMSAYFSGLG
jgi:hypothetical protein